MGIRVIKGPNGRHVRCVDTVASGLVASGAAVYVDEPAAKGKEEQVVAVVAEESVDVGEPAVEEQDSVVVSDGFDPTTATVNEVLSHLRDADEAETARVIAAEKAGKGRSTILTQQG